MSKERELLKECRLILDTPFNGSTGINLRNRITELLAQPEQTNPHELCPDCGSKVIWYHCREGTRVVCGDKCQGYKVIASRDRRAECFTKGDL